MDTFYITPAGLERLRRKVEAARAEYFAVCATNAEAAGAGDSSVWHDNFAYEENQRQMHRLAARVRELEARLASLRVVSPPAGPVDCVGIGCRVRVRFEDDGAEKEFTVCGFEDGDPDAGRLSYNSPLARAVMGKRCGRRGTLRLPDRDRDVRVVDVQPGEDR